ncbi:MAG: choice-of-anchor Q domain-containing protein [Chitinophagaceae bacterium]
MQLKCRMILWVHAALVLLYAGGCRAQHGAKEARPVTYFIDQQQGSDANSGTSQTAAWRSLQNIKQGLLHPGDSLRFKRGSAFTGPLYIYDSGTGDNPVVLADYGDPALPAPSFTNPVFTQGNYGNCIRIKGSYVIVENLYFHHTSAYVRGTYTPASGWDTTVWEMGALYIDKEAQHCIVRNNEIEDCVVGIKSYGPYARIRNNYIHDCNRVLKEWGWGPLGIWLGADNQEASYNRVFNYTATDPRINWGPDGVGGGVDGGAFEIDDARYPKHNISIHHNYTRDCQGFLEVTWTDIGQNPSYRGFSIHHNVSDDYQQFIALWRGAECVIENNTIIRRKKNVNDWGVFNITQDNSANKIRNNIIVTEMDIPVFNTGLRAPREPRSVIANNLYYAASGSLVMANEGPGTAPVYGNPLFVNYNSATRAADFAIRPGSPAANKGLNAGYPADFTGIAIPKGSGPDIGAFELDE